MASKNATAAPSGEEPGRPTRSDYLERLSNLPLELRLATSRIGARTRATTTEVVEAAESILWLAGVASLADIENALAEVVLGRRAARRAAR